MTVDASPNPLVETGVGGAQSSLTITKTDNQGGPGAVVTCALGIGYTITVTNTGSTAVNGAVVTDNFPGSEFDNETYTTATTGGATDSNPSSSGNISDTVDLPPGATITYTMVAAINTTTTTLDNTAFVQPPSGPTLSATDNNTFSFAFSGC